LLVSIASLLYAKNKKTRNLARVSVIYKVDD